MARVRQGRWEQRYGGSRRHDYGDRYVSPVRRGLKTRRKGRPVRTAWINLGKMRGVRMTRGGQTAAWTVQHQRIGRRVSQARFEREGRRPDIAAQRASSAAQQARRDAARDRARQHRRGRLEHVSVSRQTGRRVSTRTRGIGHWKAQMHPRDRLGRFRRKTV